LKIFTWGEPFIRPALGVSLATLVVVLGGLASPLTAQEAAQNAIVASVPLLAQSVPSSKPARIPALTAVSIRIDAEVGSKISKSGDTFPISLAAPILIDGKELVPAGTLGMGEVVHAKKGGFGGSAGELVLAARYLQWGDHRIALRSLTLRQTGKDNVGVTSAVAIAAGFPALFISGGNATIPSGAVASAKIKEDFVFENAPAVSSLLDGAANNREKP
jgi:hypothetical protein